MVLEIGPLKAAEGVVKLVKPNVECWSFAEGEDPRVSR